MRFSEHQISKSEEKLIVTALIVSTEFNQRINEYLDTEYITNSYLKKLAEWSMAFYAEHEKAPFKHINDIFESFRPSLKESEVELIDNLLTNLGNQYSGEDINVDYVVSEAERYFRIRELEIHVNNISFLKENDDLDGAEEEISRFNRISVKLDDHVYINPGDDEVRKELYARREEEKKRNLQLPGDLGLFIGPWSLGDVVGITAPAKRGKSFLVTDIHKHLALQKIQTLKFSIEMTDVQELVRFDRAFFPSVDIGGTYYFPEFDCLKNQIGDCGERNSSVIVREDPKSPVVQHPDHVICTKCRNDPMEYTRFIPSVYKSEINRPETNPNTVRMEMKKWSGLLNKYTRIIVHPKYSLTYDKMMRDIDIMVGRYNFVPKVILLDYVDILEIASKFDDYKLVDLQWKLLQKVAGVTKCLIITPTQANSIGHKAETLQSTDQAGFYGKNRHVNMMLGINQTPEEKRMGLYRVNVLDSRSSNQDAYDSCIVLQDLFAGQMNLDSYWQRKFEFRFLQNRSIGEY